MSDYELTITKCLQRANDLYDHKEIVTKLPDGEIHRYTYGDAYERICRLANALDEFGLETGDRVSVMAMNNYRHYELYYGPSCSGRSIHTTNHRLPEEHLIEIINEAEDRIVFVDPAFVETVESIADRLDTVEQYVVNAAPEDVPETSLDPVTSYEAFIEGQLTSYDWPELDEDTEAGLCYTSGTTGLPKGVQYTHRKLCLHAMMHGMVDTFGIGENDAILPVVPMFHVNGWGFPYSGTLYGSKLVFPGHHTDSDAVLELIDAEDVTIGTAVPTVWIEIDGYLRDHSDRTVESLEKVIIGGGSPPEWLIKRFDEVYDAPVYQGYGMTEAAPHLVNTFDTTKVQSLPQERQYEFRMKAGIPAPGVRLRLRTVDGEPVPHDGESEGEIQARAPWLIDHYYDRPAKTESSFSDDGWFKTGDVGTIDEFGYLTVVDRLDDIIKSGGEWISSLELENELMGHDRVEEAAVIGVAHEKWQERPVAYVTADGVAEADLEEHLLKRFPKWWLPDEIVFVDAVPKTTTGKFNKKELLEEFETEHGSLPLETE